MCRDGGGDPIIVRFFSFFFFSTSLSTLKAMFPKAPEKSTDLEILSTFMRYVVLEIQLLFRLHTGLVTGN